MASALPLVLLCLAVGLLDVSAAAACPPGWSLFGSRCFIVETRKLTMAEAELNCIRLGGNLASIHNVNEYNWIRGIVRRASGSDVWAWIGLSDAIQEGKWLWTDGSRFVFSHWARNEPNNKAGKEHCTHINYEGDNWNDFTCDSKLASVCVGGR
ncbi:galactose-specific lectin nattectin-like [Acanthopagrus latus]|uniref:galactose-specific lectin nattectin-like n=1 Tax=Acanthopagrus latus TaxID=8177 RepID=UPI00187C4023|nr:galactose-specific lectin nattectin-like [Acanthopagrus latus]